MRSFGPLGFSPTTPPGRFRLWLKILSAIMIVVLSYLLPIILILAHRASLEGLIVFLTTLVGLSFVFIFALAIVIVTAKSYHSVEILTHEAEVMWSDMKRWNGVSVIWRFVKWVWNKLCTFCCELLAGLSGGD